MIADGTYIPKYPIVHRCICPSGTHFGECQTACGKTPDRSKGEVAVKLCPFYSNGEPCPVCWPELITG